MSPKSKPKKSRKPSKPKATKRPTKTPDRPSRSLARQPSPHGRASKLELSPGIAKGIARQLRLGQPIRYACAKVGIDESTYQKWIKRAETGVSEETGAPLPEADVQRYRGFRDEVTRARADKTERALKYLWKAAKTPSLITGQYDTKAPTWILDRTESESFRPAPQRSEVTGKDGGPLSLSIAGFFAAVTAEPPPEQARAEDEAEPSPSPELSEATDP